MNLKMTPKRNQRSGARRRVTQNKTSGNNFRRDLTVTRPKEFLAAIKLTKKIRYLDAGTTTNFTIMRGNLLNTFLNGTTSSTCGRLLAGIRLISIEMWCALPSTTVVPATISIEWLSLYGPSTQISDSAVSNALPAHIKSHPPPMSVGAFWSLTGQQESEVLAKLVLPSSAAASTVIDIAFEMVFMDDETPVSISTSQTVTPNQFYIGYLDGQGSSSEIQPVSYSSIK